MLVATIAITEAAIETGCRRGELLGLQWNQVEFEPRGAETPVKLESRRAQGSLTLLETPAEQLDNFFLRPRNIPFLRMLGDQIGVGFSREIPVGAAQLSRHEAARFDDVICDLHSGATERTRCRLEDAVGQTCQLMRLVEDVDLVAALDRLEHDTLPELADVVDPALRCGIHLDDVERRAGGDRETDVARVVGGGRRPVGAVQGLGEDARHRRLAGAARAGEEIRLADGVAGDCVAQRPDDRLLPDHLVEALGAVLAVEGGYGSSLPAEENSQAQNARLRGAFTLSLLARGISAACSRSACRTWT
jgi:hypothetical protein